MKLICKNDNITAPKSPSGDLGVGKVSEKNKQKIYTYITNF